MDFGIGIATSSDSWKLAQRAEELGFTHAWFFDTQMITADCFVAMGAAAMKTSRIRLGTGVLVPSNRIAAVTANAFATLNGMAPGRIDFGVGTGFSARRAMGLGAMKLADMEEYIRVVYGLLNGETLETNIEGRRKKIRFLNPDFGLINTRDPIRLHVSAYGPKSQALTAKLNAGWKSFVSDVPGAMAALEGMQQKVGRRPGEMPAISTPRHGPVDACSPMANRPTVRARWRRPVRAPRCCCIARRIKTWKAGRTPRPCRRRWPSRWQATSRWRATTSRRTRVT
jgi:5,10-methylenetetrahydromethanopterin reductase